MEFWTIAIDGIYVDVVRRKDHLTECNALHDRIKELEVALDKIYWDLKEFHSIADTSIIIAREALKGRT